MQPITIGQLTASCLGTPAARLAQVLPHLLRALSAAECNTPQRAAMFIGECEHESRQFTHFEENLNYSAEGLVKVWPHHFTPELAKVYAHNPVKIGSRAYALRLGNGDEESQDGYTFRGRGAIMQTGFDAYLRFFKETGVDVIAEPDLLTKLEYAFLSAAKFWIWNGLNVHADKLDVAHVTRIIQGGQLGEVDREADVKRTFDVLRLAA